MLAIKGFVSISQYVNNSPGQTSLLGELSTWSLTYSKEKGYYQDTSIPGYLLTIFKNVETTTGATITVTASQALQIVELVKASVTYATSNIRPYITNDFYQSLMVDFNGRISNLELGAWVDNGQLALPEWISWISTEHSDTGVKIWLSNQAFIDQYDEHEIIIVPPIADLDAFFGFYNVAVNATADVTITDLITNIELAKQDHPETFLRISSFDYVNRLNISQRTPTNWGIIVYGKSGDNIDVIKDALVEYILTHSTHTQAEWSVIFPDIFKRTEFVILPRWDRVAIPNLTVASAVYSSMINPIEAIEFAQLHVPFYNAAFIQDNITILPYDYKAISLQIINGADNTVGHQTIEELFPDYIPVSSMTLDFNRMAIHTREWVLLMEQLLITAEQATEFTSTPERLRRFKRDGILFISVVYQNINYLMAARSNSFYQ